jgi:hypothetical protein
MAKHSMDPGVTEAMVQFQTVRKMKSSFVNLYQASVKNESTAVIRRKGDKTQLITGAPIYHDWYDRAQVWMHHRMGYNVVQYYVLSKQMAVSLEVVL